jgi:glucose uptake protein GlcU
MEPPKAGLAFSGATVLAVLITKGSEFPMSVLLGLGTLALGIIGLVLTILGHAQAFREPHREDFLFTAASYLTMAGLMVWLAWVGSLANLGPRDFLLPALLVGACLVALVQARGAPTQTEGLLPPKAS